MASDLRKEFVRLDGESRVGTLLDLTKACTYEQQLEFYGLFQQLLHKDFISLLPEDLVKKILSYLTVEEAVKCTLVSKKWNEVVGSSTSFWNEQAHQLGLSDSVIKEKMKKSNLKSIKDLCVSAIGHQNYIHSLCSQVMVIAKSPTSPSCIYKYAGNGITLRYREINGDAQVYIEKIISPQSMVEIAAFEVKSFSGRIKWVSSSQDYVLWKQMDGQWNGYDITNLDSELEQWTDEPVSQGFNSISFCHCCNLVVILSEAEDDVEVWDLQVIKFNKGKSTIRKMVYPLPLERVQSLWEKKRHFLGGDVTILSETSEKDESGFCFSHQLLLQIDTKLVVHQLKTVPKSERIMLVHHLLPDSRLSKPLHIFSPQTNDQPSDFTDMQVSKGQPVFSYSSDYSRAALLHESYLYIWLLVDGREESCVDLLHYNLPTDCKCIAVGSMYAVLASDSHGTCYVVLTKTGEILLQSFSADPYFNPEAQRSVRFSFYPPFNQQWLSGFQYFDFWPIALVFDHYNSMENPNVEHELKALVGMQAHSRPSGWGITLK